MCGIFGYIGEKQNAPDIILEGLKSLEYRGYDSWGVAIKDTKGDLYFHKQVGKIGNATLPEFDADIGIGHTRWATHGGVLNKNSHPHTDCTRKIVVVHNGIVENFDTIKKDLLKKKHIFTSDTDSEVIAHLLEDKAKNRQLQDSDILNVFHELQGLNAIIIFLPDTEEFFVIKSGSPIVFGLGKKEYIIASDASAIMPHTNKVYFLEDGELLHIKRNSFILYSSNGSEKTPKFHTLSITAQDISLGNYPHYMIKEIHEQPNLLTSLTAQQDNIIKLAEVIKKAYGTYFIGCGSAFLSGLVGTYLFSKIAKRHVNTSVASEFYYLEDFLQPSSLIIALSQSGETIDIISTIKKAKEKNTKIVAITNALGSSLYRLADFKMLLNAGPEKCVLATKSFTAKVAIILLTAYELAGKLDKGVDELKKSIKEIKRLITSHESIKELADMLTSKQHIFILGRGVSYPAALESALKIKEVSYIHAEGFAAGELKHGVIALIEKGTPVIFLNPEDETYDDTLSAAHEVKARGAYTIGISSKSNPVYDTFIEVKDCGNATVLPNIVIAQLIGYYLALAKGLDPDKPRNLAKSVVVK